jgi:DNA-binding NarL/FixJ family response regulator
MVRVLVVDDHPLLREGLRHLLEGQPDMEVAGEAGDGEEAVRLALETHPDVVLMDVAMPAMDGLEATRQIVARMPKTRVLVLTVHDEEEYLEGLLKAGASGYLLKSTYGPSLVEAVRMVGLGEMVLGTEIGRQLLRKASPSADGEETAKGETATGVLNAKESWVLRLVVSGKTNAEIAKEMGLSERTVKGYVSRLFDKLGVRSRSALAVAGMRLGVLNGDGARVVSSPG